VEALEKALQAKAVFESPERVRWEWAAPAAEAAFSIAKVGRLAPNFRLRRLDGTFISLESLRGRRVLINSWASW
jgi:hypothetical protein